MRAFTAHQAKLVSDKFGDEAARATFILEAKPPQRVSGGGAPSFILRRNRRGLGMTVLAWRSPTGGGPAGVWGGASRFALAAEPPGT